MPAMRRVALSLVGAVAFSLVAQPTYAQYQGQTLTVASVGGAVDEGFRKAFEGFEQKLGVKIRWVPATAAQNAAKVMATKGRPEFDIAVLEDLSYAQLAGKGFLAKLDTNVVTNYADLLEQAKLSHTEGVAVGIYFTGLFYDAAEFQKRGWAPPRSWNDMFRPEFCNHLGFPHPNVSYGVNALVLLAGGNLDKVPESITKMGKLKGCIATMEPSSPKLEEKIQLREYLIGVSGSVRIVPMSLAGSPVRFTVPEEGTALNYTAAGIVAGGNEKLAQEAFNWWIAPAAQEILGERYFPVNRKVRPSEQLIQMGMPTADVLPKAMSIDGNVVAERRRVWTRDLERVLAP